MVREGYMRQSEAPAIIGGAFASSPWIGRETGYGQSERHDRGPIEDPGLAEADFRGRARAPARPVGHLFRTLIDQTRHLLRQEIRLAGAEMSEKAGTAGRNATSVAVGGAIAFAGLVMLLFAASAGLFLALASEVGGSVALWLSPLIVGGIVALVGYALIHRGLATLKHMRLTPHKTTQSLKETGRWMQERMS